MHPQSDGMVQSYYGRTSFEGGGRTSERLGSTLSSVSTGLSFSCPLHHGSTPAHIVFGRELRLPCDILFGCPSEEPKKVIEYVNGLKEKLLSVHKTVRHMIREASDRMITRYDLQGKLLSEVVTRLERSIYYRDENQRCHFQNSTRAED